MPKTKTAKKTNKTAFIGTYPDLPARELVKLGAKQGIKFSDKYVYNVRAKVRANGGGAPKRVGRPRRIVDFTRHVRSQPKKVEVIFLVDGVEVVAVRGAGDTLGPLLYENLMKLLPPDLRQAR